MLSRVKICCIRNVEEADMAMQLGARALGLVSEMPGGPGIISEEKIELILKTIPGNITTFLLTSKTDPDEIINQHRRLPTNTLQFVRKIDERSYPVIRSALPGIRLVQVIHILDDSALHESMEYSNHADVLLLDSGDPEKGELGSTGRKHNWENSCKTSKDCYKYISSLNETLIRTMIRFSSFFSAL